MLKSMTGFGRGEYSDSSYNLKVEVKTVNHRYNDISIRMPRYINFLEDKIKQEVRAYINRGRVEIYIGLEYVDDSSLKIDVDMPLAKESMRALENIKNELNIKPDIEIADLFKVTDIINIEREILDENQLWESLKKALVMALDDNLRMREIEGNQLRLDMVHRLDYIEKVLLGIEEKSSTVVLEYKEKLENRINDLLENSIVIDEERLSTEVAIFADKSNITEEIIRLKSHLKQYHSIVEEEEPVGRKLDFLIQEMNREINTIGSKSNNIDITNAVVEVKSEIEKLREQVQNIE